VEKSSREKNVEEGIKRRPAKEGKKDGIVNTGERLEKRDRIFWVRKGRKYHYLEVLSRCEKDSKGNCFSGWLGRETSKSRP